MYQPADYATTLVFMLISMICWGSWANTIKFAKGFAFPLFYWDYIIGVIIGSLVWGLTLGSIGGSGQRFVENIHDAAWMRIVFAVTGGAVFNVANLLLVAAIEIAGMAVAFPIGIGLALVLGVMFNFLLDPKGNVALLFGGVSLVLAAVVTDALAYRKSNKETQIVSRRAIQLSIASGIMMATFYPLVIKSVRGVAPLGPYAAVFFFALGATACALPVNYLFMRRPITSEHRIRMVGYWHAKPSWHLWGGVGGFVWCTGADFSFVASHADLVGPAVSYALGQGATMVSALWGIFFWQEFATASRSSRRLLPWMFAFFLSGLSAIAMAPIF